MDYDHTDHLAPDGVSAQEDAPPPVILSSLMQSAINASLWENSVPVLQELSLKNQGDDELSLVEISVSSEPPFLLPRSWRPQQVAAGQLHLVKDLDIRLDGARLAAQTEASRATVTCVASASGRELVRESRDVRVLARNEWGGLSGIPDILAAFVMPNDPAVQRILRAASDILRQAGQSPDLNGYQTDKNGVWAQVQALWNAICALNIAYINPPASFIESGQRIRLPSQILEERLATCLDTTVLFAACLEAIGLRPVIVLTKGHAFTGVWLANFDAGQSVLQDLPGLRNRLKLDDLRVFETTLVTSVRKPTFAAACQQGQANLRPAEDQDETDFREVIDIHQPCLRRIHPLPTIVAALAEPGGATVSEPDEQPAFEAPPALRVDREELQAPETSTDRVQRWCNRLLDMSARNRLLNLPKSDRQLIEIDCPDLGRLETLLADMRGGGRAKPLRFCPSPGLMDKDDPRHRDLHRDRHGDDAAKTFALETLTRGELLFWRREDTLQTALIEIYRQARAAEKGGRDQHFQATIGFDLDGPQQGKPSLAPLSLIPVTQERPSSKFPLQSLGLTPARSA